MTWTGVVGNRHLPTGVGNIVWITTFAGEHEDIRSDLCEDLTLMSSGPVYVYRGVR